MRVETIGGREVTLRAGVPADEHPDLLALEKRTYALPQPMDASDVFRLLEERRTL